MRADYQRTITVKGVGRSTAVNAREKAKNLSMSWDAYYEKFWDWFESLFLKKRRTIGIEKEQK